MSTKGFLVILEVSGSSRVPLLPGQWEAQYEDNGWHTARNQNQGVYFHLREMIDGSEIGFPNRSLFAAVGERRLMKSLYDWGTARNFDVWTIRQLRNDGGQKASTIKNAWKEERQEFSGSYIGEKIAMRHTMAGFSYSSATEETESFDDLTGSLNE